MGRCEINVCSSFQMQASSHDWYCVDRSGTWDRRQELEYGCLEAKLSLKFGIDSDSPYRTKSNAYFLPPDKGGLIASYPLHGWSSISVPCK